MLDRYDPRDDECDRGSASDRSLGGRGSTTDRNWNDQRDPRDVFTRDVDLRETACGASTRFAAIRLRSYWCSWSWTSSCVASSASACTAVPSPPPTFATCSTPPFTRRVHRDSSASGLSTFFSRGYLIRCESVLILVTFRTEDDR
jgi:hypothetical protein